MLSLQCLGSLLWQGLFLAWKLPHAVGVATPPLTKPPNKNFLGIPNATQQVNDLVFVCGGTGSTPVGSILYPLVQRVKDPALPRLWCRSRILWLRFDSWPRNLRAAGTAKKKKKERKKGKNLKKNDSFLLFLSLQSLPLGIWPHGDAT